MAGHRLTYFLWSAIVFVISVVLEISGNVNTLVNRRFEYKYSFKPPYLAQKDGSVPFWEYGGNAIASSESVRIAPSLRSQKGAIWTKDKTTFDNWEVDIAFRISGRGRIGADGLAFWFTTEKGDYNGEVFGASDMWNGLAVFFDSFDNDNKHNNPYIMAVLNDGTKKFDHQNDGTTQLLSGCLRDFRNKPFPTRARIEYFQNILTVLFHNGMTNNNEDYEVCLRAENVILPKNGYFGVSAATGGLADDHDVFHFLTTSLNLGPKAENIQISDSDQEKLAQEYQEYERKLQTQKDEYRKDHPDAAPPKEDLEDWFESDNQRELRQIWQAQSSMTDVLRDLSKKMDEVIGRQERTMGLLSVQGGPSGGVQVPGGATGGEFRRQDLDTMIQNQNVLVNSLREVRQTVDNILTTQSRHQAGGQTGGAAAGYDVQGLMHEMRDGLNQVKQSVAAVGQRIAQPSAQTACPTGNCLGLTAFLVAIAVHLLIILGYSIYKDNKDQQAKKFY